MTDAHMATMLVLLGPIILGFLLAITIVSFRTIAGMGKDMRNWYRRKKGRTPLGYRIEPTP